MRVLPLLLCGVVVGCASARPELGSAHLPSTNRRTPADVAMVIADHQQDLGDCARRQKAVDPSRTGVVVVAWLIERDGSVSNLEFGAGELSDSEYGRCLVAAMSRWSWGANPDAEPVHATHQFTY